MSLSPLAVFSFLTLGIYVLCLLVLMVYGLHRYWIVYLYWRYHKRLKKIPVPSSSLTYFPHVTVQLPLYNEKYVAPRLIEAVCALDYPKEKLEIQVLDDSNDETVQIVKKIVGEKRKEGYNIHHIQREKRTGFKAGALAYGLKKAKGEFTAIFDADFVPPTAFLKATLPYFQDQKIGMVQTRWGHINADYSLLTRLQALFLDGHFLLEHTARNASGAFFNFNGTAGIWRKEAIVSAGGWSARTLTEDLDLSYRAQLAGWKFIFVPHFVCPAELPVDIAAFRSQQKRWTQGAIQVAKYILKDLWRAPLPLRTKIEATAHLTSNIGYLLTIVVSLLLLPSLLIRSQLNWPGVQVVEFLAFVATTISISFFYAVSQRELYPKWKRKLKDIPALLSFGIGMGVTNARAVLEGLMGKNSDFVRTPKYDIRTRLDTWVKKTYAKRQPTPWRLQACFAGYSLLTFSIAVYLSNWLSLPFIGLFLFGFSYVAGLSYIQSSSGT